MPGQGHLYLKMSMHERKSQLRKAEVNSSDLNPLRKNISFSLFGICSLKLRDYFQVVMRNQNIESSWKDP